MNRRNIAGFTFIELLVVFSIISILVVLLAPSVHKMKERGRQAGCISNQRQLALAVLLYANEADNKLPISLVYNSYLPTNRQNHFSLESTAYAQNVISDFYNNDFKLTQCPEVSGSIFDSTPVYSYGLNVFVAGLKLDVIASIGTTILLADSQFSAISSTDEIVFRHEESNAVTAYIDGHIELFFKQVPDARFTPQQD